jgi:hypothetical protein
VEKLRTFALIYVATIEDPTAVEKWRLSLFIDPVSALNTVMVDPVAVEKLRFLTLMYVAVILDTSVLDCVISIVLP